MKSTIQTLLFTAILLLSVGCEDRDDTYSSVDNSLEIRDFVWKGLNSYYYWQGEVSDLGDNRFSNNDDYIAYLKSYEGPRELFNDLIHEDDRFSIIVDDYVALENALGGISQSNGLEFGVSYIDKSTSNKVIGVVRYILPNSDAASKSIKRGDIFYAVNGIELTYDNYRSLLFSSESTYSLDFANIENENIVPNGTSVSLTKEENFQENPIHLHKVINEGGKKIGYLMYNGFIHTFDEALTNVLLQFQNEGIDELILDFRYNPGGRVSSAIELVSMVTGPFAESVFATTQYNPKLKDENYNYLFKNTSVKLNMNKVYIITTSSTASASELVINGLKPYIEVVQIGDKTVGKNVASITVKDWVDTKFNVNPNHKWAMQPIVLKISNSEGFADFEDGLPPSVEIKEQIGNYGVLGDIQEPLLAKALQHMGAIPNMTKMNEFSMKASEFTSSKFMWESINGNVLDTPVSEFEFSPKWFQNKKPLKSELNP